MSSASDVIASGWRRKYWPVRAYPNVSELDPEPLFGRAKTASDLQTRLARYNRKIDRWEAVTDYRMCAAGAVVAGGASALAMFQLRRPPIALLCASLSAAYAWFGRGHLRRAAAIDEQLARQPDTGPVSIDRNL
jgi:hypothetical protein